MSSLDFSNVPEYLRPGSCFSIGSYTFVPDEIIKFASKWDPQPFHTDAVMAKSSLFGGLCASGWHTVSVWMKLQRQATAIRSEELVARGKTPPEIGPSPGMKNLRWVKPVYAGDVITYYNEIESLRSSQSKPDWYIMTSHVKAVNQDEQLVMTFESTVFLKLMN